MLVFRHHDLSLYILSKSFTCAVLLIIFSKGILSFQAFSPNMKYLISVGNEFDMVINVWNWRSCSKVAANKVSSKVRLCSMFAIFSGVVK